MTRLALTASAPTGHRLLGVGDRSHIKDGWKSNLNARPLSRRGGGISAFTALAVAGLTISLTCAAETIPVVNGGFDKSGDSTQLTCTSVAGSPCPTAPSNQNVTGWTVNKGLVWVYVPQSGTMSGTQADNRGANSPGTPTGGNGGPLPSCPGSSNPCWKLWGPATGSDNGLMNAPAPAGGNFIAIDGDHTGPNNQFIQGRISQQLTGLIPGEMTEVSFFMAAGQAATFNAPGGLSERFQVSLCPGGSAASPITNCAGGVQDTPLRSYSEHEFSPWMKETLTFTPTSATEVLSFLSVGTPGAEPPIGFLDGVSVQVIPEPGTLALLGTGLIGLAGMARRKFKA